MIGYYVHHVGRGHAQRATAIARRLSGPVTGLSSLPRPASWTGEWIILPRDDDGDLVVEPSAHGRLHWAPLGHRGLQGRMALIADWIARQRPDVLVADVSVEITVLARSCGVPVVGVVLPGVRDDLAHQLGFALADALIAPWPALDDELCVGLAAHRAKVHHIGGLSRFDGCLPVPHTLDRGRIRVLALAGAGGHTERPAPALPAGWEWSDRGPQRWTDDVWPELCACDVVVTHTGLGALADVAAARKPAVLLPEERPHEEQRRTAAALGRAGIAVVLDSEPQAHFWPTVLARALDQDPAQWRRWSDGRAAERGADVIVRVAQDLRP